MNGPVHKDQKHAPKSFLRKVTVISTFGGLLFGYDTGVINGAHNFHNYDKQVSKKSRYDIPS